MELVGEKLGNDLTSLSSYEPLFAEGSRGELRLYVDYPISEYDIAVV